MGESKERKVVEWVLKVEIVEEYIVLRLVLRYSDENGEKEYEVMDKIACVLSKMYNISSEEISNILINNIRDISCLIHEKEIKIDDEDYHDKVKEYVQNIREDVIKAMSEIHALNKLINEAKSTLPPEYILYTQIN